MVLFEGKKCFFVTNNSTKTRETILSTILKVGITNVTQDDIVCTAWTLAGYLKSIDFKDKVYVIGSPAMGHELDIQGIRHIGKNLFSIAITIMILKLIVILNV